MDTLKIIMVAVLLVASVQFIRYAVKNERVRVIDTDKDFVVRYPRVYLWLCLVFFLLISVLVLDMLVWRQIDPLGIVLTTILAAVGIPFLLISTVWKIKVHDEYIIQVNAIGIKKQIYYRDIKRVTMTKNAIIMETTLKTFRFSPSIVYRENLFKRLRKNGVEVNRYLN